MVRKHRNAYVLPAFEPWYAHQKLKKYENNNFADRACQGFGN